MSNWDFIIVMALILALFVVGFLAYSYLTLSAFADNSTRRDWGSGGWEFRCNVKTLDNGTVVKHVHPGINFTFSPCLQAASYSEDQGIKIIYVEDSGWTGIFCSRGFPNVADGCYIMMVKGFEDRLPYYEALINKQMV